MKFEIEQKYRIRDPKVFRLKLKKLKAKKLGVVEEHNELWDRDRDLRSKGAVLRLRRAGKKIVFTFKGPRLKAASRYKKRSEIEMLVVYQPAKAILKALGYKVFFEYSKTRETYHYRDCEIVLDHLPRLGWFLEIEGRPDQIRQTAQALGLKKSDEEALTYPALLQNSLKNL